MAQPQREAVEQLSRQHADTPSWEAVGLHNILSPCEETTFSPPTNSGQYTGRNNHNNSAQQRTLQQRAALQAPQQAGARRSSQRHNINVPRLAVDYYVFALLRLRC